MVPSPSDVQIRTALRSFLLSFLPGGNAVLTGTINGATLNVISVKEGTINIGDTVLGTLVAPGTTILAALPPTTEGQAYTLNQSQTITQPATMSTGVAVITGQISRSAEPAQPDFITMTVIRRTRLETNLDEWADVKFTGSITSGLMTVSAVDYGAINVGTTVFGVGVAANTTISQQLSGTAGGAGTYAVAPSQFVGSETLSAGGTEITQGTEVVYQLDVHGPASADNAQTISTLFRDPYATEWFAANVAYDIAPLFADDPVQGGWTNAEQQWETRYIVEARLQANQTVTVPQPYADAAVVTPISVQAEFPAP